LFHHIRQPIGDRVHSACAGDLLVAGSRSSATWGRLTGRRGRDTMVVFDHH
jgi:hypothetical protein